MSIDTEPVVETIGEPVEHPDNVIEVRRRAGLAVALGAGASLVAVAYLARAAAGGGVVDWALCVVLGLIGVGNLAALLDARTPLLVADDFGVRLRLGRTWVGMPWAGLESVEHRPRRGWARDGLLVLRPRYVQRVVEDLDPAARRMARVNRRLHGAPLAVPLGLATRVLGADTDLSDALATLAAGRTTVAPAVSAQPVSEPVSEPVTDADETGEFVPISLRPLVSVSDVLAEHGVEPRPATAPGRRLPDPRPALARLIGDLAARFDRPRREPADDLPVEPEPEASATPEPIRETAVAARAEIRSEARADVGAALEEDTQVWGELHAGDETSVVGPLLIDAYEPEPAPDPVIGPQFAGARDRLGLTVDALADRTRIRPHVIEAIEVDDFSACGGDFYARGHLRTLARVLGVEVAPLLATYDEQYADAPIDPRRVFEAELAGAGSIRATRGGPNWSVLVAAVMALVLCWSIARLVTDGSGHVPDRAVLSGSGGPNHATAIAAKPVPVLLTATGGGARVVVRDGVGKVVFAGDLAYGQSHRLQASPPVRVQSTDGSVKVTVAGQDRGRMGPAGRPASASYVVRG
ncbi:helix-turn-helix domain-containing protein [Nocardioides cynanchi]|uniref:helix-turn-helix domain-containing protein n=1 Tax=Nocardioides cynanchi TaxID=2558918 RepID=UPI001248CFD2|nr:helix-turn-helix domain-containing protein [Nocardioides cynanchi]